MYNIYCQCGFVWFLVARMSGLGAFDSVVRQCLWTDVLLETITWDM